MFIETVANWWFPHWKWWTTRFIKTLANYTIPINVNTNLLFKFIHCIIFNSLIISSSGRICKLPNLIDFFLRLLGAELLEDLLLRVLITFPHPGTVVEFRFIILFGSVSIVDTLLSGIHEIKFFLINMIHLWFEEVLFWFSIVQGVHIIHLRRYVGDAVCKAMHVHRFWGLLIVDFGNLVLHLRTADWVIFFLHKAHWEYIWTLGRLLWLYGHIHIGDIYIFIGATDGEIVYAASDEFSGLVYGCCSDNLWTHLLLFNFKIHHCFNLSLSQRLLLFWFRCFWWHYQLFEMK